MINMLKVLMIKGDNMQEQIGWKPRDGNPKKGIKKNARIQKYQQKCRMPLMGSLVDWIQLRKESVNMRTC